MYLTRNKFFLASALLVAERGECISHIGGAIITHGDHIISQGYPGAPTVVGMECDKHCQVCVLKSPLVVAILSITTKDIPYKECCVFLSYYPKPHEIQVLINAGITFVEFPGDRNTFNITPEAKILKDHRIKYVVYKDSKFKKYMEAIEAL